MGKVCSFHYDDVRMGAIASQITSLMIVYSIVYSDVDQRKHQSSASLAFVRGIHRGPVNSPHNWPVTRKMFPFDDVIMWYGNFPNYRPSWGESTGQMDLNGALFNPPILILAPIGILMIQRVWSHQWFNGCSSKKIILIRLYWSIHFCYFEISTLLLSLMVITMTLF